MQLFNQVKDGKYLRNVGKKRTLENICHYNMIRRSTSEDYKVKFPTYADVTVSDNFKDFQYFAEWCNTQVGFGKENFVLDKDIIYPRNKVYAENTCVFVPTGMNSFFTFIRSTDRGLPTGVTWCESEGKYKSYCSQLNGKNKTLGRFNNPEDAYKAYYTFKEQMARQLACKYENLVDDRVIKALLAFKVENYIGE